MVANAVLTVDTWWFGVEEDRQVFALGYGAELTSGASAGSSLLPRLVAE
jgi:hypothetical protein